MHITDKHVSEAFEHFHVFAELHGGKPQAEQQEPLRAYREYVGMTDSGYEALDEHTRTFVPKALMDKARGWVAIGFLLGLDTAQRSVESG